MNFLKKPGRRETLDGGSDEVSKSERKLRDLKKDHKELGRTYETSRRTIEQKDQEISVLRRQVGDAHNYTEKLERILAQRDENIKAMIDDAEMKRQQFQGHVGHLELEHNKMLTKLTVQHSAKTESLKQEHHITITNTTEHHENHTRTLKRNHNTEREKLMRQLLAPADNNQGSWADDKLKVKFKDLQRRIQSISSEPTFSIAAGGHISQRLDPTNICIRLGPRGPKYRFVLQSIVWKILETQFFSVPFGFGVLGPGEGKQALMNAFFTFRKLSDEYIESNFSGDSAFYLFQTDKLADKWRCATFSCIQETVSAGGSAMRLSQENHKEAFDQIIEILTEVSQHSGIGGGHSISPGIRQALHDSINLAEEIAFQLGIHAARLQLFWPRKGDRVVIGEDFWHCEDSDRDRGDSFTVDLAVVPGMQKIGDGVSQFSKRSITPSEFYPDRS